MPVEDNNDRDNKDNIDIDNIDKNSNSNNSNSNGNMPDATLPPAQKGGGELPQKCWLQNGEQRKPFDGLREFDVLLGRGRSFHNRSGNRRFRALINMHRDRYLASRNSEKKIIKEEIVDAVLAHGRFLKFNQLKDTYTVVSKEESMIKVCHAIQYQRRRDEKNAQDAALYTEEAAPAATRKTPPPSSNNGRRRPPPFLNPAFHVAYGSQAAAAAAAVLFNRGPTAAAHLKQPPSSKNRPRHFPPFLPEDMSPAAARYRHAMMQTHNTKMPPLTSNNTSSHKASSAGESNRTMHQKKGPPSLVVVTAGATNGNHRDGSSSYPSSEKERFDESSSSLPAARASQKDDSCMLLGSDRHDGTAATMPFVDTHNNISRGDFFRLERLVQAATNSVHDAAPCAEQAFVKPPAVEFFPSRSSKNSSDAAAQVRNTHHANIQASQPEQRSSTGRLLANPETAATQLPVRPLHPAAAGETLRPTIRSKLFQPLDQSAAAAAAAAPSISSPATDNDSGSRHSITQQPPVASLPIDEWLSQALDAVFGAST